MPSGRRSRVAASGICGCLYPDDPSEAERGQAAHDDGEPLLLYGMGVSAGTYICEQLDGQTDAVVAEITRDGRT